MSLIPRWFSRGRRSSRSKNSRQSDSRRGCRVLRMESLERRELLAITPQALLPDLAPWANEARSFIYGWTIVGNDLRLTTAMANIGTGPMELRGGATHPDDESQDVFQRVYEPGGSFTDVLAGTFTYHPEHGHIHFDEFAQFRLRAVLPGDGVGDIVAAGDKVSFCLLDVERFDTTGPSSPQFLNCGQIQGISVGWADVYSRGLEGQSIEITNLPDGSYWLEVAVDPGNHIIESNETNNVTRIKINLQRPPGGGGITPDAFEPNNSFNDASILAPPEDHVYPGLSIHASTNADFYRVTASASGPMAFRTTFLNSQGNVDMEVFDASRERIGRSITTGNTEQFMFNAVAGQFYFVRIFGAGGATNPNYTFTVDQPEGVSGGAPDIFEENDTFATARGLTAVSQTYTELNINTSGDDDYYKIVPTASGTLTVNLAFLHAEGDIDLEFFNAAQTRLAKSDSVNNSEQISIAVIAGQTYYVRVFGYRGATNEEYSMTLGVPAPPVIPPDSFEENDTPATARSLAATDQTYPGLTINASLDDDYYTVVPTLSGTLSVSLAFQNAQGNVDLQLLNASQTQLGLSATTANSESLSVPVTAGQTYYIRAFGSGGALSPNYSMTVDVPSPAPPTTVWYISSTGGGNAGGNDGQPTVVASTDADILKLTVQPNGQYGYALHFDGSDVALTTTNEDVDAFTFLPDGSILISTLGAFSVPGAGATTITGGGEDLLRFVPTSLGATTTGTWSMYFDGSDVNLTGTAENIDGVSVLADGRVIVSTTGAFTVTGATGLDEDLIAFTPTTLGASTTGTWALYFDGSDVGLDTTDDEDVRAFFIRETGSNPTLFLTTLGNFAVTGATGANEDSVAFAPISLGSTTSGTFGPGLAFDGSLYGLSAFAIDGIYQAPPAGGVQALRVGSPSSAGTVATSLAFASTSLQSSSAKKVAATSNATSSSMATNANLLPALAASTASKSTASEPAVKSSTAANSKSSSSVTTQVAQSVNSSVSSKKKT